MTLLAQSARIDLRIAEARSEVAHLFGGFFRPVAWYFGEGLRLGTSLRRNRTDLRITHCRVCHAPKLEPLMMLPIPILQLYARGVRI